MRTCSRYYGYQFRQRNSAQNQHCAAQGAQAQPLAIEEDRRQHSKDRLQREDECGVR